MENIKFIYADLQKPGDKENTLSLTTLGTSNDLQRHNLAFKEGGSYWFWTDNLPSDPLIFKIKVRFSKELNCWVGDYNPATIRPFSQSEFNKLYSVSFVTGEDQES